MTNILYENFEKRFLEWEKIILGKIFRHFLNANCFMFILLTSNHTVFLIQFGINLHLWVFQNAEIALAVKRLVLNFNNTDLNIEI